MGAARPPGKRAGGTVTAGQLLCSGSLLRFLSRQKCALEGLVPASAGGREVMLQGLPLLPVAGPHEPNGFAHRGKFSFGSGARLNRSKSPLLTGSFELLGRPSRSMARPLWYRYWSGMWLNRSSGRLFFWMEPSAQALKFSSCQIGGAWVKIDPVIGESAPPVLNNALNVSVATLTMACGIFLLS